MEAPLSICTKEEMRGAIRFLFAEGVKPVEIISRMQAPYCDNCLSRSKIYEWIDHFKKGRTSVCDEERSGGPSTSRNGNNIQAIERTIQENGLITVDYTAEALNISHGSATSDQIKTQWKTSKGRRLVARQRPSSYGQSDGRNSK
jgi:transposase